MSDAADRALLLQMAAEVQALHRPKVQVTYQGLHPDWDGTPTADLDVAMIRREQTVCTAGCGDYPCETLRTVNRG